MQQPPFNAQSNFRTRDENWSAMLAALTNAPVDFIPKYDAAVAPAPDDWILAANFARVLEAAGDLTKAEKSGPGFRA